MQVHPDMAIKQCAFHVYLSALVVSHKTSRKLLHTTVAFAGAINILLLILLIIAIIIIIIICHH